MVEAHLDLLRPFELRLLRCSFSPSQPIPSTSLSSSLIEQKPIYQLIESVVSSIEEGNYLAPLSSDAVRQLFPFADAWEFEGSAESADWFYSEVENSVNLFLGDGSESWLGVLGDEDSLEKSGRALLVMCIGLSAFLAFVQCNITGPVENFPAFPISIDGLKGDNTPTGAKEWDMWARKHLMFSASDLLGKFLLVQYIAFAKILLVKTNDICFTAEDFSFSGPATIIWWLCRLLFIQQKILDERASSLFDLLQVLMRQSLHLFGQVDKVTSYWGTLLPQNEALAVVSMVNLESAIIELFYARVDSSRLFFNNALEVCGLQLSVKGVLGFRRVHQVDPKAQLVLVTNQSGDNIYKTSETTSPSSNNKVASDCPEQYNNSDVLLTPKLLEEGNEDGSDANIVLCGGPSKMALDSVQQAVVLAQCLVYKKSGRNEEYTRYEMAPYIEAIDSQQSSCHMVKSFCNYLRIEIESNRGPTMERALIMMDKLVQGAYDKIPGAAQRLHFSFCVHMPTIPALRKEYGEHLVRCGLVGEALRIFEDLELWDNLIVCYSLLGKKPAAVDLIRARLLDTPNDPRLWCSLGDVTITDAYYEKALEVSNNRSARAKRSLARSAYNRGDYEKSKVLWASAMNLNSLFPDGWFAYGAAALKARDFDTALDAFRRAVQLDPDNGEAWNNIACLHQMKKKNKEAFIAFKEALKFRRNSWQMWENFAQVAMDTRNFSQAIEAVKMVLDLSNNKRVETELLEKLTEEIESRVSRPKPPPSDNVHGSDGTIRHCSTDSPSEPHDLLDNSCSGMASTRETENLMDSLGKVLQQIVKNGCGGDIWGLYARYHKIKGDLTMYAEALLKQVRSYQGSELWHNHIRFKKFACASLHLCNAYMEIASSPGHVRELAQAELHLRNTIKQAERYSDTEEYRHLQSCYNEVKSRMQAAH